MASGYSQKIQDDDDFVSDGKGCSWWTRKSVAQQFTICLIPMFILFCTAVALSTIVTLGAMSRHHHNNNTNTTNSTVCMTPDCVAAAGNMLLAMDMTADPCVDFFQYACGGFVMRNSIPAGQSALSQIDFMTNIIQKELRGLLEQSPAPKESEARAKSRTYYLSCLNRTIINQKSNNEMAKLVSQLGGFFLKKTQNITTTWSLDTLLANRNMFSISGLFSFGVGADDKNVSKNIIQINQGGLGLGQDTRDYYINKTVNEDPVMVAYATMLNTYAQLIIGADMVDMDLVYEVVTLEQKLAEIQQSQADMRDPNVIYNKVNITWMQQKAPFIDWLAFVNSIMQVVGQKVTTAEPVLLYATPYVTKMTDVINMYMTTMEGKRTLQNYIVFQAINDYASKLSDDFQTAYNNFQTVFAGTQGTEETWQTCVADTDSQIGFPLGAMYVDKYFGQDAKDKASFVIDSIIATFRKRVENVQWMDDTTRQAALGKLDLLSHDVAFPDWIDNDDYQNKKYANFTVTDDYVANQLAGYKYTIGQTASMLHLPPDPERWEMTPPTVDAYYEPTQNKFVVPSGILSPVFFFKAAGIPELINFAAIGTVTGHEITHGFDDQGSQYDKYGNLNNWWNNATLAEFNKRTKCLVDQYDQYQVNGLHLRGEQTLGENLADNGGILTSFEAYQIAKADGKIHTFDLVGVPLTPDQLFFVGYAQVQCSIFTPQAMELQILGNPHSPAPFRVIGPLSNSPDFANAFKCPINSPMNPQNKCAVW